MILVNKKIAMNKINFNYLALLLTFGWIGISCENDFKPDDTPPNTNPPSITSISLADGNTEVTQGVLEGFYKVRGENLSSMTSVLFDGVEARFNPAILTDSIAFVNVPSDTAVSGDNIIRIETLGGSAEMDFPILNISGYIKQRENDQRLVVISGAGFSYTPQVLFTRGSEANGNLEEFESTLRSVTDRTIVAEVPDEVTQAFIQVNTSRGASNRATDSYGFNFSIYEDQLRDGWVMNGFSGTQEFSNEQAIESLSIKRISQRDGGLSFFPDVPVPFNDYETITFKIFGSTNASRVKVALNDFDAEVFIEVETGIWTTFNIDLNEFYSEGEETEIDRIDFQESSGDETNTEFIFYLDDLGFL